MLDKLEAIKGRFDEVNQELMTPDVMSDMKRFSKLNKEYKELNKIVVKYEEYKNVLDNVTSARELLAVEKDADFREMAKAELDDLSVKQEALEIEIKDLLIPTDPNDSKNVILEIRAGAGGDEASIFAGDIYRMYSRYAEILGWKMELID